MADHQKQISPDDGENSVDAAINARLTRHLLDGAIKLDAQNAQAVDKSGFWTRLATTGGIAFLMSILGLFSLFDKRTGVL